MIAEYWSDGPYTEQPPGHWAQFAQFVSVRDHHTLNDDVKMFFVLANAMLDASIAAWTPSAPSILFAPSPPFRCYSTAKRFAHGVVPAKALSK